MFTSLGPLELLVLVLIVPVVAGVIVTIVRKSSFNRAAQTMDIPELIRQGWRIETETNQHVVLVTGHRVNHILHFLVTVFTVFLWLIPWILISITGGEKRKVVVKPSAELKAAMQPDS